MLFDTSVLFCLSTTEFVQGAARLMNPAVSHMAATTAHERGEGLHIRLNLFSLLCEITAVQPYCQLDSEAFFAVYQQTG